MVMHVEREIQIEDLRNHSAEMVSALRNLLAEGAKVTPDPKRIGFYEVENGAMVYYIYASPSTDKIMLLATWPTENALAAACQVA